MSIRDKIYFASDFHLGAESIEAERTKERRILRWLDNIAADAIAIHLVGDVLDYWMEYREVVPRGHFRLFAKLHELVQKGISVHYHVGNHDLWHGCYLEQEVGLTLHFFPLVISHGPMHIHISHGDEMECAPKYQLIRKLMRNKFAQWLYRRLHPNTGIKIMRHLSQSSRHGQHHEESHLLGNQTPIKYISNTPISDTITHYISGHWHHPLDHYIEESGITYINLGDWITHNTYAVSDTHSIQLREWLDD